MDEFETEYYDTQPGTLPAIGSILNEAIDGTSAEDERDSSLEKSLLVLGSRTTGKSTFIIDAFTLPEDENKPTLALNFFCALYIPDDNYDHLICNIWELADKSIFTPILFSIKPPVNLGAVLMLDLSKPNFLCHTINTSLDILRSYVDERYREYITGQDIPDTVEDRALVNPFPLPLFIVGGKYDLFQSFEPEQKRTVCQFLRYLAHTNYAFLFFYSNVDTNLSKAAKDIFSSYAFGTPMICEEQFDHNQALVIPRGRDSVEKIEGKNELTTEKPSLEKYQNLLNKYFKQEESNDRTYPDNPSRDPNFKEPRIDYMKNKREEVLEKLIRETENDLTTAEKEAINQIVQDLAKSTTL